MDYYGWYVLWLIPVVFLFKNKKLFSLVLVVVLLTYPTFTYDNFSELGYAEDKYWSDELSSIDGWSAKANDTLVNTTGGDFEYDILERNGIAIFQCDMRESSSQYRDSNFSIIFSKNVSIALESDSVFVFRARTNWDPTFYLMKFAHIRLEAEGVNQSGHTVREDIVTKSGTFTNLTFIHWRENLASPFMGNVTKISKLSWIIYPLQQEIIELEVDYMYLTRRALFPPPSLLLIPLAVTSVFIGFFSITTGWEFPEEKEFSHGH
jgi:hypothetical protein